MNTHNHILLFDGVCNLCNRLVQFVIKRDKAGKIKFASLQSEFGQQLLAKHGKPTNRMNTVIYIKNEKCFQKSSAVLHLLKDMGGGWKLMFGFIIIPWFIRDFFYMLIARSRYRIFGKRDSCMIPTPELKSRFLD